MLPKFLDLDKPRSRKNGRKKKNDERMYDIPVHDCTQEQNGSPRGPSIFPDKSGGRRELALQCSTMQLAFSVKKRLFRSRNFATMVTWRHTSPLHTVFQGERHMSSQIPFTNEQWKQFEYSQWLWRYTFALIWFFTEVDQLIKIL